jgi:hypothetical protein
MPITISVSAAMIRPFAYLLYYVLHSNPAPRTVHGISRPQESALSYTVSTGIHNDEVDISFVTKYAYPTVISASITGSMTPLDSEPD